MMKIRKHKNKQTFIKRCNELAKQYENDVLNDRIIVCEDIKLSVKREIELRKKYSYKQSEVNKVFSFFYYIYIEQGNNVAQFLPAPWQAWIVMCIFGLYDYEGDRVRDEALIFVARKSGKTTFAAVLLMYLFMKGNRSSETYVAANTFKQASQLLRYAKQIVRDSPVIKGMVKRLQHELRYTGNGVCKLAPVANEPNTLDGLKPSSCVLDEVHEFSTKEMYNIMKTGFGASVNPLLIQISTAGFHPEYPLKNDIEMGKKVLRGELGGLDNVFYALFSLDSKSEIDDPEMWIKSNPGIGYSTTLKYLKNRYSTASFTITDKREFIVKNLNEWLSLNDSWIDDEDYLNCYYEIPFDELQGARAWMGIDLSKVIDLTGISLSIEHPVTKKLYILPKFFFPGGQSIKKIRPSGIDLTGWIDRGWIEEHKGKKIDMNRVFEVIQEIESRFQLQSIAYDPYNATDLIKKIELELFVDLLPAKQGAAFYNAPLKYLEGLILDADICLSDSPVLRWNFMNSIPYYDTNNNLRLIKNKQNDSIDGTVATAMAIGAYLRDNSEAFAELLRKHINN